MQLTPLDPWIHHKISASQPRLTRQAIEAWQLTHLNRTIARIRTFSPFYRRLLSGSPESISSLDELTLFPFTTSKDIRENPLQFICVPQGEIQRVVTLQSSGTTGEPKRIYFTADDQELTIDFFGVGMSTLTEPGERVLILLPGGTPGSLGELLRIGLERKGISPIPHGPVRDPGSTLETMQVQQVDCLVGSPTQVLGLARRWNQGSKAPRTVLLSTDYVPMAVVHVLEEIWGCMVFNHYGTTEMGLGGGVECEAHHGYHLREADLYFEIVHPKTGKSLPTGEYGEVVFTTLTRQGMPLLRYRMGDRSRFLPGVCPCGTNLKMMERVSGRINGSVAVGDAILNLPDFDEALFSIPDLLNFTVTVLGDSDDASLCIETQMLTRKDRTALVEQALVRIPSIQELRISIRCQHSPNETGSLRKRVIIDHRDCRSE